MDDSKLSKKQKKALEFKQNKTKEEREQDTVEKKRKREEEKEQEKEAKEKEAADKVIKDGEPPKKRKTRRGKKGKGVNSGSGPRFLLFIGNLPYDVQQAELVSHFKNSAPDRFRIRTDKGIAFMEFDNDTKEIQSKMELALKMHHTVLRSRKINVELTVGGGGNSENRLQKLKEKNEVLLDERRLRVAKEKQAVVDKKVKDEGMHPARAALLQ